MELLYENEYYEPSEYIDAADNRRLDLAGGKGCEFTWSTRNGHRQPSLRRTAEVAFGVVIPAVAWEGGNSFDVSEQDASFVEFAFNDAETRDKVKSELKRKKGGYSFWTREENGLFWLSVWAPV